MAISGSRNVSHELTEDAAPKVFPLGGHHTCPRRGNDFPLVDVCDSRCVLLITIDNVLDWILWSPNCEASTWATGPFVGSILIPIHLSRRGDASLL